MTITERILEVVRRRGRIKVQELCDAIPEYPRPSIRSKASILAKMGVLRKVERGVYELAEIATEDTKERAEDVATRSDVPLTDTPEEKNATTERDSSINELRQRVFRLLRRQSDATPEELAEVLSANTDTIRCIIRELIDQGELEPPSEGEAATPAEEKNIKSIKCFYAPICRDIPGMRKVCEAMGSLLCEQQKTARSATATS